MKIKNFLNQNQSNFFSGCISFILFIFLSFGFQSLFSQATQGPLPQWILEEQNPIDWNGNFDPNKISDEWWYGHTKIYDSQGVHIGYAACGYSTWPDAQVSSASQNNCYVWPDPNATGFDCEAFETDVNKRGPLFQTIGRYDLQGNMVWCKRYNNSQLHKIIQDSDGNLVAVGVTWWVNDKNGAPILYHSAINGTGTALSCTPSSAHLRKFNVVKVDMNGDQIFNKIYGMQSATTGNVQNEQSQGEGLIEYQNGYRLIGSTTDNLRPAKGSFGFMIQTDKNGIILSKEKYRYSSTDGVTFLDLAQNTNGDILVVGNRLNQPYNASVNNAQEAFVHFFPVSASNTPNITNFKIENPSTSTVWNNSRANSVEFLDGISAFAVPVLYNNKFIEWRGWNGDADGQVIFYADDFSTQGQFPSPVNVGHFTAYDLKLGITKVSNGFAIVSSVKDASAPIPNQTDINNLLNNRYPNSTSQTGICQNWFDGTALADPTYDHPNTWIKYWDTDAYISRYEINPIGLAVTQLWETTFGVDANPREPWSGDIKRQECLYTITADDADEAIVIAGNTSNNFDDNYFVKLNPDDCIGLSYDIHDNTDDIYEINTNTIWNTNKTVLGEIRVLSGNTLTISGSSTTITMSDSKKTGKPSVITVEKGAKLVVDGATITHDTRCTNTSWDGIRLLGDNGFNQLPLSQPLHQAKLELRNNALLDHVDYAIMFGEGGYNDFGGLVEAEDATIRVNRRAAEFMRYPFDNNSTFKRCTLEYVNSITLTPLSLVTAWDNHGAKFYGCTFQDNTGINEYTQYGANGIFSIDATYEVLPDCSTPQTPCPTLTNSSFTNFNQAIYSTGSAGPMQVVNIENTDFYDNSMAFRVEGIDNVRFIRNTVENGGLVKTGYSSTPFFYNSHFGVHTDQSTGYTIEENEFEKTGSQISTVGVNIINSGTQANEVYRNTFKGNDIGQQFIGQNRNSGGKIEGLQFICNDNPVSNSVDVLVDNNPTFFSPLEGIKDIQGSAASTLSAANKFSTSATYRIDNNTSQIITYHHNNSSLENPTPFDGAVAQIGSSSNFNFCAVNLLNASPSGMILPENYIADYYTERANYDQLLYTYFQNIDGGNTDSLLNAIALTFSSEAQQLRDDLMSEAPYLSQGAILDAAYTGILSDAFLLEICFANPDATHGDDFLNQLEFEIPNPLPANMIQMIYQNWDAETPRTILENQLAESNGKLGRMSSQIIHHYVVDSLDHTDSIKSIIASRKNKSSKYQLIELAIANNEFEDTYPLIEFIENNYELTEAEWDEHNNLKDYRDFRESLYNEEITYMQLDESQLEELRSIANAVRGRTATLARNILCFGYQECESEFPEVPSERRKSNRIYDFNDIVVVENELEQGNLNLYPNPFKENITIQLTEFNTETNYHYQIRELSGKSIDEGVLFAPKQDISMTRAAKGSYLFILYENGQQKEQKLIIKQ